MILASDKSRRGSATELVFKAVHRLERSPPFSPQRHERRTVDLRLLEIGTTEGIGGRRVGEALKGEADYRRTGNG
jgi:hypothetical protein